LVDSADIATSMTAVLTPDNENISEPFNVTNDWFDSVPAHLLRQFSGAEQQGIHIKPNDGKKPELCLNFASNDYLGLRYHPDVVEAAVAATLAHGLGSGSSRMVTGDDPLMHQLEAALASWKGYQACLLVGSGMLANIGLMQALTNRHTHIFSDKLNHASLIDGIRLSSVPSSHSHRFAHRDYDMLEMQLHQQPAQRRIIVSDGVFSMDGDSCELQKLLTLAEQHDTLLVIDDAHGIGVTGKHGRGLSEDLAGHPRLIEVGTFGKAFGGYGAFILATHSIIEGLRQRLRTMIYSTAMPISMTQAMHQSLQLILQGELRLKLQKNLDLFRSLAAGLPLMPSDSPIQPFLVGAETDALFLSQRLRGRGFIVPAIRPPTVPKGTSRLRITLSAMHNETDIGELVRALEQLA